MLTSLGSHEDTLRASTESRDLLPRLVTAPNEPEHRLHLARTLHLIGEMLSQKTDQQHEGIRCLEEVAEILEGLVRASPDDCAPIRPGDRLHVPREQAAFVGIHKPAPGNTSGAGS